MTDLSRKQKPRKYEPNGVEICALIITVCVWVFIIIGAML